MNMMNRKMILRKQFKTALIAGAMSLTALAFGACGNNTSDSTSTSSQTAGTSYSSALAASTNFTERDLEQSADTTDAVNVTLNDGEVYTISDAGVYVLSGSYTDTTIVVDADDSDKVQLVVDGLTITNSNLPAVLVKNADKVFVTTTDAGAEFTVEDKYSSYDDIDTDAIDSNGDLYINGGTIDITANSPFDYDGTGELNGGDVTTNGTSVTELTNQMMGGGGMGGPGGQMSGRGGNRGGMR